MSIGLRTLPALPLAGLLVAGTAHAETRAGATVGVEAGYGSNPFLQNAGSEQAGSLIGRFDPTLTVLSPTTQLSATGHLEHIVFDKRYSDLTNWSLGGVFSANLSPRSQLGVNASYTSHVQNSLTSSGIPGDGEEPPLDPAEGELAGRRIKTASGGANFSTSISARDTLTISAFASDVDYDDVVALGYDYRSAGTSLGMSHALNANTTIGASLSYSKTDYDIADFGTFQQISPSANATLRLSPRVTLTASAGAAFSRIDRITGVINQVHFSGDAELCYEGIRSKFCGTASRSLGASARLGNSSITSVSLNYSYRLSPRGLLGASAQYSNSSSITGGANYSYAVASANYRHELGRRLSISVTARYTEPFRSLNSRRKGFYGGVGVNYRLGR